MARGSAANANSSGDRRQPCRVPLSMQRKQVRFQAISSDESHRAFIQELNPIYKTRAKSKFFKHKKQVSAFDMIKHCLRV